MTAKKEQQSKTSPLAYLLVLMGICAVLIGGYYLDKIQKRSAMRAGAETALAEQREAENNITITSKTNIDIQEVISPKGLTAWLVEDKTIPVLSIDFSFQGGLSLEKTNETGLAYLTSIMLDEGAGPYNSQDFQKELANHVIDLGFSAGRDHFNGSLKTLTQYQDKAFELLRHALTQPRFDDAPLARMKNSTINSILRNLGRPNWNAARLFNGMVFEGHSYARPGQGNLDTIPSFTSEDLQRFAKQQFVRSGLKISVSGDISAEELAQKLDTIFGDLPEGEAIATKSDNAAINTSTTGKTYVFDMDIPQSIVQFAHQGLSIHDPDYPAAALLEYILGGGGFSSRLMQSLREDHGLTYGVFTSMSHTQHAKLLQGQFSTKNETAAQAIDLLKTEWQKMAETGPTARELQDAKNYLIGSFPLVLTSTNKISGLLNVLQENGRDIQYINDRTERINAVTVDQVKAMAKRLLKKDDLTFVVVGKPEGLSENVTHVTTLPGMALPAKGQTQ